MTMPVCITSEDDGPERAKQETNAEGSHCGQKRDQWNMRGEIQLADDAGKEAVDGEVKKLKAVT
ncbi:hypothetical protein PQQ52_06230 [Paraburkholderia sediminicola]